ncbi:MAG: hypothetical protein KDL87_06240, partial [Verrucomicrobiae bacterium]|nr:hypothetical protein [Verrucomicrobiae bacterium]
YLFDLSKGTLIRKLLPTGGNLPNAGLGCSVAINDRYVVAGAAGRNLSQGTVAVFDRMTGDLLFDLEASDGANTDSLGDSVAVSGNLVLAGAPGDAGSSGAAYVFDASRGTELAKFDNPDGGAFDFFGTAVAFNGRQAVIGSENGGDANEGAVFLFDLLTQSMIRRIDPPDLGNSLGFGHCLDVEGSLAVIGAVSGRNSRDVLSGAAYVFDLARGEFISKLSPPDGDLFASFGGTLSGADTGNSVALYGNRAFVGAPNQDGAVPQAGAVYGFYPLAGPLPLDTFAAVGDFVPGAIDAVYSQFGDPVINDNGQIMLPSVLGGPGSKGGKRFAMVADIFSRNYGLVAQSGVDPGSGLIPVRFGQVTNNQQDLALFNVVVSGAGVTPANNQLLFGYDGDTNPLQLFRTGDLVPAMGGVLSKIGEVAQGRQNFQGQVAAVELAKGINGVTSADDSGLLFFGSNGVPTATIQEGDASPLLAADPYGTINRVGLVENVAVFRAGIQSDPAGNEAVFRHLLGGATEVVARKGDTAPGAGAAVFQTFLGETISAFSDTAFRATLRGAGVTSKNNEGLWSDHSGSLQLIARKGDQVPGMDAGVVYSRILQFSVSFSEVFFVAKLAGPGIKKTNDCAAFLLQSDDSLLVLLREGDEAPGCDGAKVGVLQRVELGYFGSCAIVASLAGTPAARNQALWSGDYLDPNLSDQELRRPFLQFRKGSLHSNLVSNIVRTRSIVLPKGSFDRSGAGLRGAGSPINSSGQMAICVQFDNRAKELLKGKF